MTNEELQQEVKRLEEQLTELRIKILESKTDKKPYEVEVPEDIADYYYADEYGYIYTLDGFSIDFVHSHYQRGLAFKTREEAERHLKESMLLFKMHKWAEEYNEGWKPDWEDEDEIKYFIIYDNRYKTLKVDIYAIIQQFSKLPYFKTEEIAEQFIEEFGDEIKEVLC
nr:MAG TPA: hypothetical protein [Caudoviricetes sp.]